MAAVSFEGHPEPAYDGVYRHDSTHEGWPVLKNDKGMYCYRYTPKDQWMVDDRFTPDDDLCAAYVVAKEGPLPVGAHTWACAPEDAADDWNEHTLTVTLQ